MARKGKALTWWFQALEGIGILFAMALCFGAIALVVVAFSVR